MSRGKLLVANLIGLIVILALIAGGVYFYYQNSSFVKTDEAHVQGDRTQIVASAAGVLNDWNMNEGDKVSKDDKIAKVKSESGSQDVKTISDGTIVKNEAQDGQLVQAGQALAEVIDMDNLYVTANIKETDLSEIEVNDKVDVTVDGDPGSTFEGTVEKIGYATNSTFDLLPQTNASGNYTKTTQKVQVKISISNPSDKVLPGMNASVKIEK
ncbi:MULTISPECIES: efflux RND transporter periplasmic adaptor subunit [Bacillus]|uniref:Transporter n=2 Tax=Bacillus TaxID=1386 RepID=A0A0M5JC40_9BACI|nr:MULTISPECIES: HlyD family efflux transporter periplasmic adaptor subunit [Bacillus]ALC82481.1 transporter [Bacillus gobiensis]MBP1081373.1 multidrug resistance efflux pump [Bacillus capparidis]MED1096046.1 efflux RND transporter periplasmic adaptor subunit [Bacillus capparidis]